MERRIAAVLAADVVGYSRLMEADEIGTLAVLQNHRDEIFTPQAQAHQGRVVKLMGDGILMVFDSVVDAVTFGVEVQKALSARNEGQANDKRVDYRIGINLGDIVYQEDDIFGDGVNVAARLEGLAEPGGLCISGTVYDHVKSKLDCGFEFLGEKQVKNIQEPVRAYKVYPDGANALKEAARGSTAAVRRKQASIAIRPFRLHGDEPQLADLVEAFCEDLEIACAQLGNLQVLAATASLGSDEATSSEQRVDYLLQGSLRLRGDALRINAQIIHRQSGFNVWADRFESSRELFAAGADDLVESLAATAQTRIRLHEGANEKQIFDERERAEHLASKAWSLINRFTPQAMEQAESLCQAALSLDPQSARAHQVLACVLHHLYYLGYTTDPTEVLRRGLHHIDQSADINDEDEYTHWVRGNLLIDSRSTEKALAAFTRAREINPAFSLALASRGTALAWAGRHEESIAASQQALSRNNRDPSNFFRYNTIAVAHFAAGSFEEALLWAERTLERKRRFLVPHVISLAASAHLGKDDLGTKLENLLDDFPEAKDHWQALAPYTRPQDQAALREGMEKAFR